MVMVLTDLSVFDVLCECGETRYTGCGSVEDKGCLVGSVMEAVTDGIRARKSPYIGSLGPTIELFDGQDKEGFVKLTDNQTRIEQGTCLDR
jgi:hypothetical protein